MNDVTLDGRVREGVAGLCDSAEADAAAADECRQARLARAFHVEVVQPLTALKMDVFRMRMDPGGHDGIDAQLRGVMALADEALASTQRLAAELRPWVLDDLGLSPAIESLAAEFTRRTGARCTVDLDDFQLDATCASGLFRIAQEWLDEAASRRNPGGRRIGLGRQDDSVVLCLESTHSGPAVEHEAEGRSLASTSLRSRVHLLRGSLAAEHTPDRGTRVTVRVPL